MSFSSFSQEKVQFKGQLSAVTSYNPNNYLGWFAGARYIPEASYKTPLQTNNSFNFLASADVSSSVSFRPFNASIDNADLDAYRIWARYATENYELRVGLQKIDFGSASLLRPLQWFNQIDPRDPLRLTNGVQALLGRYYFADNTNIWLWMLSGNDKTRGSDVFKTDTNSIEFGGRLQLPIAKGELAFSYHHRTANVSSLQMFPFDEIAENRIGIDAKVDITVGFWVEATHNQKSKNVGLYTNQTLITTGADYTFGISNGLNVVAEHLVSTFDEKAFAFKNTNQTSALSINYPLGLFTSISAMYYQHWNEKQQTALVNIEHQFEKITSYFMLYYNPEQQQTIQQNDLTQSFSGAGIRIMLVYNH